MKKCIDTNKYVNLSLLQVRSMPIGHGLLSPATILLNRLVTGLLHIIHRMPILYDYDNEHFDVLK